jgi:uncharacterized protein (DUF2267 family)
MSAKGLEVIDHTVQLTHEWINELATRLDWGDSRQVLHLLRATLAGLRDHLSHDEAAQLAAQLPILIRGMFYEGWRPSATPLKDRSKETFVARIGENLGSDLEYRGEQDISEVLGFLSGRITAGEIADVLSALPAHIRELWPE